MNGLVALEKDANEACTRLNSIGYAVFLATQPESTSNDENEIAGKEAREALKVFKDKAREVCVLPPARAHIEIEKAEILPIAIYPEKRCKLDRFGMLALQIVLWMWYARRVPNHDELLTTTCKHLKDFDSDSVASWWNVGKGLLNLVQSPPRRNRRIRELIPISCRTSLATENTYFLSKVRTRFYSFAPMPH